MTQQEQQQQQLAIIGGGITGLTAAYYALKNGQDPASITIYESTERLGGKIKTGYLSNGKPVNMGAEFIDSEHTRLIQICNELGVKLNASTDQGNEIFQKMDGSLMKGEAFHAAYEPLAERIRADKAAVLANPDGPLANRINAMSMNEYIADLRATTPAVANPSLFTRLKQFFSGNANLVSAEIATMAMQSFASEVGQPPQNINALQFLHEASAERGSFLESDCAYRVDGGTENIIKALEKNLKERGVKFEQNATAKRIEKHGNGSQITFADGRTAQADKLVLALPAYALGAIDGLETLGMHPKAQSLIANTQYTNSVKFTVKLKEGVPTPDGNFFANHGMQVWSSGQGELTFLVNADKLAKMPPKQLVDMTMKSYADAQGTSVNALFDLGPGNIVFNNPGKNACYASPAPGQAHKLEYLSQALDGMHAHGVTVAGTYLPVKTDQGIGLGFMECGVASAERGIDALIAPQRERPKFLQQALDRGTSDGRVAALAAQTQREQAAHAAGAQL